MFFSVHCRHVYSTDSSSSIYMISPCARCLQPQVPTKLYIPDNNNKMHKDAQKLKGIIQALRDDSVDVSSVPFRANPTPRVVQDTLSPVVVAVSPTHIDIVRNRHVQTAGAPAAL